MIDTSILENSKILIVDDVLENVKRVGKLLQNYNVKISIAQNGLEAIKTATQIVPDIILMDVNMPEMDGYEATDNIKKIEELKDIPVIFLTALNDADDMVEAFDKGGVDYVTKPFNNKVLIARLVTHLRIKRQKESLIALNNDLVRLDLEKTKFLSIVSHDLRSPFTGILGLIQILKEDYYEMTDETKLDFITDLKDSLDNQYVFLESMLKWGNLQFDRVQMSKEMFNLDELVNRIFMAIDLNAKSKSIKLIKELEIKEAYGDFNLVYSIIHNLVVNSVKYTNENGTVSVISKEIDGFYQITIKDNGIGMSKENCAKLFKLDEIHSTLGTNNEKGTGLGLFVTQESVLKHNGKIWVESELGVGSQFHFTLEKEN